jgi:hypothetical protein
MKRAWLALAACIALALTSGGVASANVTAGTGRAALMWQWSGGGGGIRNGVGDFDQIDAVRQG